MQAFGLMVTAEPYYSVTTPSDVVVAENVIRPDTIGAREEVVAKYELLPRGQYTMTIHPADLHSYDATAESLPYDRYEALLELYQAENAVQIARSLGADQFASESFSKAATLLSQAEDMSARRLDTHSIVWTAREWTQMAEDARTIAVKRRDEDRHAREIERSREEGDLRRHAEEDAAQARADAQREDSERIAAEQARADAERAAAIAERQAAIATAQRAPLAPPPNPPINGDVDRTAAQQQHRTQLFAQLNSTLTTRDTPRGLVVTVSDSLFEPGNDRLRGVASQPLANLAAILSSHPGLSVRVEGYADSTGLSDERAHSVRTALVASGAAPDLISAVGYGNSRPIVTPASAEQNRRVEVVIYGDAIGNHALWDHPHSLRSER
jgi:outer membrane protein OmpA-like peptidoglycan-associated protein